MAGQKINDHGSWIGAGPAGVVFPAGAKMKSESSAEGVGALSYYEDTTEAIKAAQELAKKKVLSHPRVNYMRN